MFSIPLLYYRNEYYVPLVLDAVKLREGHTYTIRAEIWGQIAETEFIAVRQKGSARKSPVAGSKKKSGRKRKKK